MLYRIFKRLIELGQTDGLQDKPDAFFAVEKIIAEEYDELRQMMGLGIFKNCRVEGRFEQRITLTLPGGVEVTICG